MLISRLRWAGVGFSLLLAFIPPAPASLRAALWTTLAIGLYNLVATLALRGGPGRVEFALVLGLAGDFVASTAWLLLTGGDTQVTFLVYVVVAIEAAATFGWAGTVGFIAFFLSVLGLRVWEGTTVLGSSPPAGEYVSRSVVVLMVAVASGAIASRLQGLGQRLLAAGAALEEERDRWRREAADRRQAEEALGLLDQRLRTMVRNAPVVLLAFDRQGQITLCEGAGLSALGRRPGQWVGWSVRELYADQPKILEYIRLALSGQTVQSTIRDSGRTLAVSYGPSRDNNGELVGAIGVALDVTEREQAEAALREQTELYEALIRAQSDLGDLVIVSEGEKPIYINAAVSQLTGYTREELDGMPSLFDLIPEAERDRLRAQVGRLRETSDPVRFEATILHKDGRRIDLEAAQLTVKAGGQARTFTIARDVTARHQVEAQRQALLNRLVRVQEEERQQIANDIHDDSIQTMFAVKIRLHLLKAEMKAERHLTMLAEVDRTIDQAITRLRHLVFELRPVALDEEGLAAGIRAYLHQMRTEAGPDYELVATLPIEPDPEVRATLYRIAQEALANVRKHASAAQVAVSLAQLDGGIMVKIKDDGRGFRVAEATHSQPGHLGLAAMRERAEMAGGWLRVASGEGDGTEIQYWIPHTVTSAQPAA